VLDSLLAFLAALIARDPVELLELTARPDFIDKLYYMLGNIDRSNDPLWLISSGLPDISLKRAGIGRTEKPTVS
jgi:hypothetical protein